MLPVQLAALKQRATAAAAAAAATAAARSTRQPAGAGYPARGTGEGLHCPRPCRRKAVLAWGTSGGAGMAGIADVHIRRLIRWPQPLERRRPWGARWELRTPACSACGWLSAIVVDAQCPAAVAASGLMTGHSSCCIECWNARAALNTVQQPQQRVSGGGSKTNHAGERSHLGAQRLVAGADEECRA